MTRLVAVLLLLLSGLVFIVGYWLGRPSPASGAVIWSAGPTVTHLESLGELVATRVNIADVLEANDRGYRGSWLIKGDALISIDMSLAVIVACDRGARTATIRLPQPKVLSPRVNHERSMTWRVEKRSWIPWVGDEDAMRDHAMSHAQRLVDYAANSRENLAQARASAEHIIEKIYRMVEWKVAIEWAPISNPKSAAG